MVQLQVLILDNNKLTTLSGAKPASFAGAERQPQPASKRRLLKSQAPQEVVRIAQQRLGRVGAERLRLSAGDSALGPQLDRGFPRVPGSS